MDTIKEKTQLNKVSQITKLVKEASIDSSLIRTMVGDMADLKGKHPSISNTVPHNAPPAGLPVVSAPLTLKSKIKIVKKQGKPTFVLLTLVVIVIIGGIGGFFYWWNYVRPAPPIIVVEEEIDEPIIDEPIIVVEPREPSSIIPVATTETIELIAGQENLLIGQLKVLAAQEQENDTFKRVLVKLIDQAETRYADLSTLMLALGISIPEQIFSIATGDYTLFFYNQSEGNRLGLIIKMGEGETLVQDLKAWETNALNDIKSMILVDEIPVPATEEFQDNTHNDVYIRYMNFDTPDLSLDYGLVPENLVLSTSRESMFATIDALLNE